MSDEGIKLADLLLEDLKKAHRTIEEKQERIELLEDELYHLTLNGSWPVVRHVAHSKQLEKANCGVVGNET
jgi:hypothetical protein